jgi:hypothetical protein
VIPAWAKTLALLGVAGVVFHGGRIHERRIWRGQSAQADAARTAAIAARDVANAQQPVFSAHAETKAVTNYVQKRDADVAPVVRAITRIRNVCVRDPDGDPVREPMPKGAGAFQAPGSDARDGRDDAFVAALERDIKVCSAELARLDASARYLRLQDGDEQ